MCVLCVITVLKLALNTVKEVTVSLTKVIYVIFKMVMHVRLSCMSVGGIDSQLGRHLSGRHD